MSLEKRLEAWEEVENLVLTYQKTFDPNATFLEKRKAKKAIDELLKKFFPLFKKYIATIKKGTFSYKDKESKSFVALFMGDKKIYSDLQRQNSKLQFKKKGYAFIWFHHKNLW